MTQDRMNPRADAKADVIYGPNRIMGDELVPQGYYEVWCVGADGKEKWRDTIKNLVTTVGKNDFLDKYLLGSAYTQTIRMGLAGAGTKAVGDTQASHAGW